MHKANNINDRYSSMPKISVIQTNDENDQYSEIFARVESANNHLKDEVDKHMSEEKRKKTIRKKNLLWEEASKKLPVDSREGATFTVVGD